MKTFHKTGMSLVEVMIGVVLLALIIVPSLNVITSQTKTVTATRDHASAAFLSQKIQEMCRGYSFDLIEADQYSSDTTQMKKTFEWKLKNDDNFKKHDINGITYEIKDVKIEPIINSEAPTDPAIANLIFFAIEYVGKDKKVHRLEISTALSKRN
jgi:Tfp pilus assembly protein PilE